MLEGIIVKGIGGFYYVDTAQGIYECRARGKFRKDKITPTVGDYVRIEIISEIDKKGNVNLIKKRKNILIRPKVANIDMAVIVFASVSPNINLDLLDRFLVLVAEQELEILICINKIDLDKEKKYKDVYNLYKKAGYNVIAMSVKENIGIDELKLNLSNKVSVFAGPSGVGKSSIINAISPLLNVNVGEISAKIERGKHTTRHAELMEFEDNSYIVDSPGFTSLMLNHINPLNLQYYFKEFDLFLENCRFSGCNHINEPGCKIKEQVGNSISEIRYNRYVSFFNELKNNRY